MVENQDGDGDKFVYFLVGAGIGAITALLFAPKAGSELRSEIADGTRKGLIMPVTLDTKSDNAPARITKPVSSVRLI